MLLNPIRFEPFLRPTVWGGRRLEGVLGKHLPTADPYGESWEISDHASHHSKAVGGPLAGRTLHDLMQREQTALLGASPTAPRPVFPWLVKFLDAQDWLSVQVHPDDEAAPRLWPGEMGKTEAWFVLDAAPTAKVYAGLLPGVDEKRLRTALKEGTVAECLHSFRPRPGDCLFLPAGTVHAVGGGVLMAEVQQTSDATFRLFDWNRLDAKGQSRTLHVEEALASINWKAGPVRPVHAEGYPQGTDAAPSPKPVRQPLVACRYFNLDYIRQREAFACGGGKMQVIVVAHGRGTLSGAGGSVPLGPGDAVLLPAGITAQECWPEGDSLGLLRATLP